MGILGNLATEASAVIQKKPNSAYLYAEEPASVNKTRICALLFRNDHVFGRIGELAKIKSNKRARIKLLRLLSIYRQMHTSDIAERLEGFCLPEEE